MTAPGTSPAPTRSPALDDLGQGQGPQPRRRLGQPVGRLRREVTSAWREPLLRNGHFLTLSSAMTSLIGLVYWSVAAHHFTTAAVGRSSVVISAMMLIGGIGQMNLMSALVRFVPVAGRRTSRFVIASYAAAAALAAVIGTGFLLAAPQVSKEFSFVTGNPWIATAFVASTAAWTVFVLQDSVLTGLRQAVLVGAENTLFSAVKVAAVVALAGLLPADGIVVSWWVGLALALAATNTYLFCRALPRHTAAVTTTSFLLSTQAVTRYAAADYLGGLSWLAVTTAIPLIVIAQVGARDTAYFSVVWQIGIALFAMGSNMGASLVVETASDQSDLARRWRRVITHTLLPLGTAVAVLEVAAPVVLRLFGADYSRHASTLLRLIALVALPSLVTDTAVSVARSRRRTTTASAILATVSVAIVAGSAALVPLIGIVGVGVACLAAETAVAAALLARRSWWLGPPHPGGEQPTHRRYRTLSPGWPGAYPGRLQFVATVTIIALSATTLAAGVAGHHRWLVALSVLLIAPAVVTLILYSRKTRAFDTTKTPGSPPDFLFARAATNGVGQPAALPIDRYDLLRIDELLPLLQHLDPQGLRLIYGYERTHQARRAVLRRIETLLDASLVTQESSRPLRQAEPPPRPTDDETDSVRRPPSTQPVTVSVEPSPGPVSPETNPPITPAPVASRARRTDDETRALQRQAAVMFADEIRQAEIARRLGVARQTISRWHRLWADGGDEALQAGPAPRISSARLEAIAHALKQGPTANGYPNHDWTLGQVIEVIEGVIGTPYHPAQARRLLSGRLHWTPQEIAGLSTPTACQPDQAAPIHG